MKNMKKKLKGILLFLRLEPGKEKVKVLKENIDFSLNFRKYQNNTIRSIKLKVSQISEEDFVNMLNI